MNKYISPFPDRQIRGSDFNELVEYLNSTIEESNLTNEKLKEILGRVERLNLETDKIIQDFQAELFKAQKILQDTDRTNKELSSKVEGFYGRQIELFGVFIAIFSFIIAGIQIAAKAEGNFVDKLGTSASIFIPITFCIALLLFMIRKIIRF